MVFRHELTHTGSKEQKCFCFDVFGNVKVFFHKSLVFLLKIPMNKLLGLKIIAQPSAPKYRSRQTNANNYLTHEAWDNSVERGIFVTKSLFVGAKSSEIFCCLWDYISSELRK
jgi:hypothetical protein